MALMLKIQKSGKRWTAHTRQKVLYLRRASDARSPVDIAIQKLFNNRHRIALSEYTREIVTVYQNLDADASQFETFERFLGYVDRRYIRATGSAYI